MNESPLDLPVLFHIGPVPVTEPVVVTWGLIVAIALLARFGAGALAIHPGRRQAAAEIVVTKIADQIREITQADPEPFLPLLGTLFIFLVFANLSLLIPGVPPPTARIETAAALALIVFVAVQYFSFRRRGLRGYLGNFAKPNILLLPLNVLSEFTRVFSMMIRLFGNIMSGEFVIAIAVALAGFLVPIPLMALEILIGLVQAYIFTVLAAVFIGAATRSHAERVKS